ncbi:MAG: Ada metal-binding domain-containing protein [Patescibacteria group bacterium]
MEKIKHFIESNTGKDILTIIIIILVGLGSFGLGRLSKEPKNDGLRVEYAGDGANVIKAINEPKTDLNQNNNGIFFASNKGSKYYSLGCSAGKTIKQENRVYFNTREEAERAGYALSSSCR